MFIYYVYAYLRIDGSPYYIGKGSGRRAYWKHRRVPLPKNKSLIVILESNLSNVGALSLERRYINWYGRKDLGTGILINMTDGGENPPSHKGKKQSPETIEKRIAPHRGAKRSAETCANISASLKGKKASEETKAKMSAARKGQKRSPESRARMREARLAYLKRKSDLAVSSTTC
jgi:hypothetical protein